MLQYKGRIKISELKKYFGSDEKVINITRLHTQLMTKKHLIESFRH